MKYWYDTQAWLPKNAVLVNRAAFNALDKPTQDALLKAAADAETRGWALSQEKNQWYLDQLKAKGMNFVDSDQAAFAARARPAVLANVRAEARPLLERMMAAA